MIELRISPEVGGELAKGAQVITVPAEAYPHGLRYLEYVIGSYDNGCPYPAPAEFKRLKSIADELDHQLRSSDPEIAVGIAPLGTIAEYEFSGLDVKSTVRSILEGHGRRDILLLMAKPSGQGDGKAVLDGAISWDLIRRAKWAVLSQDTQQVNFLKGQTRVQSAR